MAIRNLLAETLEVLKANNKTPQDVLWVGTFEYWSTWEEFERVADFNYNAGYGGAIVNTCAVVVGNKWWLERGEYDGSEWWEFKTLPIMPFRHNINPNLRPR